MTNQTSAALQGNLGLDHVGFIVRDVAATHALLAQLGFTLTRRADHTRVDANGKVVSAGSAQHSIMLQDGYIELMQITDATAGHPLAAAAQTRLGLHVLALGTGDAQASHARCTAQGLNISPVANWSRPVDEASAKGLAQFAFFGAAWSPSDPSFLCWVQHLTPGLLRPPGLTSHANGALRLTGIDFSGPTDAALVWAQQLIRSGGTQVRQDASGVGISLQPALIRICLDAAAQRVLPTALHFEVADIAVLQGRCAALGLTTQHGPDGSLVIDLQAEFGMPWSCKPASHENLQTQQPEPLPCPS